MSIDTMNVCRSLGVTLNGYLDGQVSFSEFEVTLSEIMRKLSVDPDLIKQLYHVVNHYEIDAGLRAEEPQYETAMTYKLREIAASQVGRVTDPAVYRRPA